MQQTPPVVAPPAIVTAARQAAQAALMAGVPAVQIAVSERGLIIYATMTTAARLENNTVVPNRYALGVGVQNILGHPAVSHDGAIDGFQAYLVYFPDQEIAVAVVTNAFPAPSSGNPRLIAMAVAQAALPAQ